mgnify:CR=1 FL=1
MVIGITNQTKTQECIAIGLENFTAHQSAVIEQLYAGLGLEKSKTETETEVVENYLKRGSLIIPPLA